MKCKDQETGENGSYPDCFLNTEKEKNLRTILFRCLSSQEKEKKKSETQGNVVLKKEQRFNIQVYCCKAIREAA